MATQAVGIDLGTTFSVVACVDERGIPHVLSKEGGECLIPSVVWIEDDAITVGQDAKDNAVAYPDRVIECVKRSMGSPHARFRCGEKIYTPQEISAMILREMKGIAERALGAPVNDAVITVPAYFLDAHRTATRESGELAGLNVLKILNEPTAAALAYGLLQGGKHKTIMVYDLGGGTFDISVMRIKDQHHFEMLTTAGNRTLGGKDWDRVICDRIAEAFVTKYGLDPMSERATENDLMLKSERAKIGLSERQSSEIVCHFGGKTLKYEMKREEFEKLASDLLNLTAMEVGSAASRVGLSPSEIDLALLVGGSSRMPMVQKLMQSKAREVRLSSDPDRCVALGAAIEAARLTSSHGSEMCKISVRDRTAHALGNIAVVNGQLRNTVIIPKDTEVPCQISRDDYTTIRDGQDILTVHLVQGEDECPDACAPLASFDFTGIPPRPAGMSRLRITYRYNSDTIVEASAEDIETGKKLARSARPFDTGIAIADRKGTRRVVLLLDSSGSMQAEGAMDEARDAACLFISRTDFQVVRLGLIQFGNQCTATILQELTRDSKSLTAAVRSLTAEGSTPMAEAVELGAKMLEGSSFDGTAHLVLFTDGMPDNEARTVNAAERARAAGIHIASIGVGGADRRFLKLISSSHEDAHYATDGDDLKRTFGNLAQVLSTSGICLNTRHLPR